eukprot:358988-Chlamydomonas_euryale.AAC.7
MLTVRHVCDTFSTRLQRTDVISDATWRWNVHTFATGSCRDTSSAVSRQRGAPMQTTLLPLPLPLPPPPHLVGTALPLASQLPDTPTPPTPTSLASAGGAASAKRAASSASVDVGQATSPNGSSNSECAVAAA